MCLRTDTDTVAHKYLCIFEVDSGDRSVLPLFCITQACGLAARLCVCECVYVSFQLTYLLADEFYTNLIHSR